MKKKVLGIGLALAMALSMGAMAETYTGNADYIGDTEQGPEWYYMYTTDGGKTYEELTLHSDWADSWQVNAEDPESTNYYSMCYWGGLDAQAGSVDGTNYDIVLAFKAPADGNVKIAEWNHFGYGNVEGDEAPYTYTDPEGMNPGTATIKLNDEELYSGEVNGVEDSGKSPVIEREVKAGDMIYFICGGGGNTSCLNISLDSVSVDFTAAEGGEKPSDETPAEENPTTGEATTALPVMAAVVGLAALVLAKKAKKA